MGKWSPDLSNRPGAFEKGPATRVLTGKGRLDKKAVKFLRRFTGDRLARVATRLSKVMGRSSVTFEYLAEENQYLSHDGEPHGFAHPKRIGTVFGGHLARGRRLGYQYLLDQVPLEDGDWILDVGANTGDLALAFRAMRRRVNVEAFEPSPPEFKALQRNLEACSAIADHRAHNLALWNAPSEGLTFYLTAGHADHSVVPIKGATGTITIPAKRLSDIIGDDGRVFRLLKLEAEGVEPEILEGAEPLLPRIEYIAADVGFERGVGAESTLPQIANFLLTRGFEIVGFEGGRYVLLFRNTAFAPSEV